MNLTKITQQAGVAYLLKTVVFNDQTPGGKGAMAYYTTPGTPPGMWMGSGVGALGIRAGDTATRRQAQALFSHFAHPNTLAPLGNPPRQLHDSRAQSSDQQVSGFDLTFRMPKSISVLWGTAAPDVQAQIMDAHHEAIRSAMAWFEDNVASTRSGKGGVASSGVRGVIAIAYDHFETRDGDPHLHTHVALANRVRRASDGKWLTLDGRAVYRSAVAMSEVHENMLLDLLHDRLGMQFHERPRPDSRSAKAVVADVLGFPLDLIHRFSTRDRVIKERLGELEAQWLVDNPQNERVPHKVRDHLHAQAWRETRRPKEPVLAPLTELSGRWRQQLAELGHSPADLAAATLGHPPAQVPARVLTADVDAVIQLAYLTLVARANAETSGSAQLGQVVLADAESYVETSGADEVIAAAATTVHARLSRARATWTRFNARAEAERLTRLMRCRPGDREALIQAIADKAVSVCVPVTPHRYSLPETALDDARLAFAGRSVFDNPNLQLLTSQEVLDAEAYLQSLTTTPTSAVVTEEAVAASLRAWQGRPLAPDQAAAARHITTDSHVLTALVGPAGAGKTTTMKAVHEVWTTSHGQGSVIGVAPSARAAAELSASVGIDTHTLAMLLIQASPDAVAARAQRIASWRTRLGAARSPGRRAHAAKHLAAAIAHDAAYTIKPGTLVVVDEASMCSTHDLAQLSRIAQRAGAKVALVGDPAQLDAVDAGGMLGWIDRQGKAAHLTTLFRFSNPWEAAASLRLRGGDATVWFPAAGEALGAETPVSYADAGRIADGADDEMLSAAYDATRDALAQGRSAVLIAATNEHVGDLNLRTTLDLRASGCVDSSVLIPLRGQHDAGRGDQIYARRNDYKILDSVGTGIYNGDLLTVEEIHDDGSATCRRVTDPDVTITLPRSYLGADCELGYAVTAHRAQGITVDEANVYIPYGARMTRELLYVAMTRGRNLNKAWVGVPDAEALAHENQSPYTVDVDGTRRLDLPTGAAILARATAAVGAEMTAHEQRETEIVAHTNLGRLVAEHEYLASVAATPHLLALLEQDHGADMAARVHASPTFDALVSTWRRARAVNPERADRLLRIPLTRQGTLVQGTLPLWEADTDGTRLDPIDVDALRAAHQEAKAHLARLEADGISGADLDAALKAVALTAAQVRDADPDPAAIAHWRLATALVNPVPAQVDDPAYIGGQIVPVTTDDTQLADLATQSETMVNERIGYLTRQLGANEPPAWTRHLPAAPDQDREPERHHAWMRAALTAAIYRDLYAVATDDSALGPVPAGDRRQLDTWENARDALAHWDDPHPKWRPDLTTPYDVDPHADIDWEELDPGDPYDPYGDGENGPQLDDVPPLEEPAPGDPWMLTRDDVDALLTLPEPPPSWRDTGHPAPDVDIAAIERIAAANAAALDLWRSTANQPRSWVPSYLAKRGMTAVEPVHAPAGWTTTYDHLRGRGFSDADLITAGLVTQSSRGNLIDRFRDRIPLPIHDQAGRIAGFTARANPREQAVRPDTQKYLNTGATPAFVKSRLLYGLDAPARAKLAAGAVPVLVEGALDAAAVSTIPGMVGLASCGTAVTTEQLAAIAEARGGTLAGLVAGFDQDGSGVAAAARLWELLGPADAATVRYATWTGAKDPGELVETGRTADLARAITDPVPLSVAVVRHYLATTPHTGIPQQVVLTTGLAGQILPCGDLTTIMAAQDELTARLTDPERGGLLDAQSVAAAFMGAVDDVVAPSWPAGPAPAPPVFGAGSALVTPAAGLADGPR